NALLYKMGPMAVVLELTGVQGSGATAIRMARDGAILGRSATVDVPIADPCASRQHARINRRGDDFEIDNLSPNGTLVNGKPVQKRVLKDGDVIQIGAATQLRVRYLKQTGAVVSHLDNSDEAAGSAAFDADDGAAQ